MKNRNLIFQPTGGDDTGRYNKKHFEVKNLDIKEEDNCTIDEKTANFIWNIRLKNFYKNKWTMKIILKFSIAFLKSNFKCTNI